MKAETLTTRPSTGPSSADGAAPSAMAREYHALLGDFEHLIGMATSMSGEDLAKAKAALTERVQAARALVGHAGDAAVDRVKRGGRAADDFVTERPWQAVGVAAAAALLVGYLLGRRGS